jgi:hypothetical protein
VHARDTAAQGDPEKAPGKPRHPEDEDATKQRRKRKKTARYAALTDAARVYPRGRCSLTSRQDAAPQAASPAAALQAARLDTTALRGRAPGRRYRAAIPNAALQAAQPDAASQVAPPSPTPRERTTLPLPRV